MNKAERVFIVTVYVVLAIGTVSCQGQRNTSYNRGTSKGVALFNGKNLDGWYTFIKGRGRGQDPRDVFTVKDGMIRISGEEYGCITTKKEYENYHLITEFKRGLQTHRPRKNRARDTGILLHSVGEDGAHSGTWMNSLEVNIIEGGTGDFIVVGDGSDNFAITSPVAPNKQNDSYVYQPGGRLVTIHSGRINWFGRDPAWKDTLGFRGSNDIEKPLGEWNTLECIAKGDSIRVKLNGVVVNRGFNVRPSKGRIQLQSEGSEIFFRKVVLIPL